MAFILKVLVISAGLSILIKYAGSALSILPTPAIALIVVFVPSIVMSILLWWRSLSNGANKMLL